MIGNSNTVIYPLAMMVKSVNAFVTNISISVITIIYYTTSSLGRNTRHAAVK